MARARLSGLTFPLLLLLIPLAERLVHEVREHGALHAAAPARARPAARAERGAPLPLRPAPVPRAPVHGEQGVSAAPPPAPAPPAPAGDAEAAPEPAPALAAALVAPLDGPHVVLAREIPKAWALGMPRLRDGGPAVWAESTLDPAVASRELWAQAGAEVILYGREGEVCRGRLQAPTLASVVFAEAEVLAAEAEVSPPDEGAPNAAPPQDLPPGMEARLRLERGVAWAVAAVEPATGDCAGALWARSARLPAPLVLRPSGPWRPAERRAAWRAARLLDVAALGYEGLPPLDEALAQTDARVLVEGRRWRGPAGRVQRVLGWFEDLDAACGDGDPRLAPMWVVRAPGGALAGPRDWVPLAVFDADRDGRVEYVLGRDALDPDTLVERALARENLAGVPEVFEALEVPFVGCPC